MQVLINFPPDVAAIGTLVESEDDLRLMMPTANLPFDEAQWKSKFDFSENTLSFFLTEQNKIIGHFALMRIDKRLGEAWLGLIYLRTEYRKSGASRELIKIATEYAFEVLGLCILKLNVRSYNLPAVYLYLKSGFEEFERIDDLIRMQLRKK